jgi:hypothetical protein
MGSCLPFLSSWHLTFEVVKLKIPIYPRQAHPAGCPRRGPTHSGPCSEACAAASMRLPRTKKGIAPFFRRSDHHVRQIDPRSAFAPGLRTSISPVFSLWSNPPLLGSRLKKNRPRVELRAEFLFSRFSVLSGVFLSINFWINPALFQRQSRLLGECDFESPHVEEQRFPKEIFFLPCWLVRHSRPGPNLIFAPQLPLPPFPKLQRSPNYGPGQLCFDTCRCRVISAHRLPRALHSTHANLIRCKALLPSKPEISVPRFPFRTAPDTRCGFPVRAPLQTLVIMSAYYESSSQWPPSGQAGWDHQTPPPPARSG